MVKPDETLSEILYRNVPGKIYGREGNLLETLRLNPTIKNKDVLLFGYEIYLPKGKGEYTQFELDNLDKEKATEVIIKKKKLVKTNKTKKLINKTQDKNKNENEAFDYLLGLDFSTMSIKTIESSVGSSESVVSDAGYGINLKSSYPLSKRINVFLLGALKKYKFSSSSKNTLTKSNPTILTFAAGTKFTYQKKHEYSFYVAQRESLILLAKSKNNLELDKFTNFTFNFMGEHHIAKFFNGNKIKGLWSGGLNLPKTETNYKTKLGTFWTIGTSLSFKVQKKNINTKINYGQEKLKTDLLEQTAKHLMLGLEANF